MTTAELDRLAEKLIRARGGVPTFLGYRGFPASICASPNDMVVHGIPGPLPDRRRRRAEHRRRRDARRLRGRFGDHAADGRRRRRGSAAARCDGRSRSRPAWRSAMRVGAWATCRTPCRRSSRPPVSAWYGRLSATASAGRCTRIRRSPTTGIRAADRGSKRAWCSPSSRWSTPAATKCSSPTTAGASRPSDGSLSAHFEHTVAVGKKAPRVLTRRRSEGRGAER